ncbi:class I SAM-dependent methyltransferase [Mycolicibacter sp. MYC123]|uniref:Class I SAM-dependent methyltransferase n=1 Tax=[Mycobacterium] zoologicum TaxID=2872311 RepID=A0ABU5YHF2_9MYCO|nr:class I SAM-dependent methyltransferase [Mycolicibacter sp. MYC123]MEB3049488.1 class I SAM-dependent methyltransferase [Mycolicibacter sp. MYC123]
MSTAAAEEYVASLYTTILKRDPRPEELDNWVNVAMRPEQVYFSLVESKEYQLQQDKLVPTEFLPGHFHSPIVDPSTIVEYVEKQYAQEPDDIKGIDLNESGMVRFWNENIEIIKNISFSEHDDGKNRYYHDNGCYPYSDAVTLYAMITNFKPKNIIEVGSGFSTACMLDVADDAGLSDLTITCIDPSANRLRGRLREKDYSRVDIIEGLVQNVPVSMFSKLNKNDILFIDSTHVLKTGSDVHYELFSILPSLNEGVLIHFHDIGYPFEYSRPWLFKDNKSWNEAYALQAFLMYNPAFEVVFWNGLLAQRQRKLILETLPLFLKNPGGSIWLRAGSVGTPQARKAEGWYRGRHAVRQSDD